MKWYLTTACLLSCFYLIENANILAVFPMPGRSHFMMFEAILKGLAERGHQVDVLNHFPQKTPIKGYNDLSLVGTQQVLTNSMPLSWFRAGDVTTELGLIMETIGTVSCEATFQSDVAKNLRNSTKQYDLVITELFSTDCMLGWGYHFKAPNVVLSTTAALPWANDRFGNPDNPAYIAYRFSPYMTLYERCVNTLYLIYNKLFFSFYISTNDRLAKEFFGKDLPDLSVLAYNTSLFLVNSHFSIYQARPTVPNFVEVAGVHLREPQPLNKYFEELLTTDKDGVIYFSMGSMVMSEQFEAEKLQGLVDALGELPYKVVWKGVRDKFPKEVKFPDNIHFAKWMPQMDILCHPNVKLFITHGGLMGSLEAFYCGVPRLGIPLFGDQEMNILQAESLGIGLKVSYDDVTKETILDAATKLLTDPGYQQRAKEFADRFKDRPMSPLNTSMYWIEYVIKHKGAPQLRSAGSGLYWYQYHLLDVAVIFLTIPLVVGYLLFSVIKLLLGVKAKKSKKD